jgi:hypothetical protein
LGPTISGHWNHHGRKGRIVSQTVTPGYDELLGLLNAELAVEERSTLMGEGAALDPNAFVEYLRCESLFAPA